MPGFDGYVTAVQWAGLVTAVLIAISSVDDLFVDAVYWLRRAYRRVAVTPRHERLPLQALYDRAEQPIAIMIPAWREEDVIASMVENAVSTLDYRTYVIFIGTYPNDPDTIAEVERLRRRYRRIIRVDQAFDMRRESARREGCMECVESGGVDVAREHDQAGAPVAAIQEQVECFEQQALLPGLVRERDDPVGGSRLPAR